MTSLMDFARAADQMPCPISDQSIGLGRLHRGAAAQVVGVDERVLAVDNTLPEGELERRLLEMGFIEGADVRILHEGFPGRDPIAVRVNGCTIALRRAEANAILVRLPPANGETEPLADAAE